MKFEKGATGSAPAATPSAFFQEMNDLAIAFWLFFAEAFAVTHFNIRFCGI